MGASIVALAIIEELLIVPVAAIDTVCKIGEGKKGGDIGVAVDDGRGVGRGVSCGVGRGA